MVSMDEVEIARANWKDWKDVFEHSGQVTQNPLLADRSRWDQFREEYKVRRTIRKGTSEKLRERLASPDYPLLDLLDDSTGKKLDKHQNLLRSEFGTHGGRNLISAVSKIAAFLAPHAFIAWDKYARPGVNIALGRARGHKFADYASYRAGVAALMASDLGSCVRAACKDAYPTPYASRQDRFHLRVLDVYLMRLGGRKFI